MYYRKYRPQTIDELDNAKIRLTLGRALLENQWVQSYLLTGPKGIGKTSVARLIAKIVNCGSRKRGQEPCNKCWSCKAIMAGTTLDIVEIDAASNRGIDEIRELREKVKLAPANLTYKVYIVDEVHMMTAEAFNALLKTLEEPPPQVIFVLATTDVRKLPATIISRCQHYEFTASTVEESLRSLERVVAGEKLKVDREVLEEIATSSEGSFRDAHKLLEQLASQGKKVGLDTWRKIKPGFSVKDFSTFLELLTSGQKKEAVLLLDDYVQSGRRIRDFEIGLIHHLRDLLLLRTGIDTKVLDMRALSEEEIVKLIQRILEAIDLSRNSPIAQLPLELLVAEYQAIDSKKVLSADQGLDWAELMSRVRSINPSLLAILKAARPIKLAEQELVVEVFYKFHKDRLEEERNKTALEKVVSDIIGKETKVKLILRSKN